MSTERRMPERANLGQHYACSMGQPMLNRLSSDFDIGTRRSVMGYPLPSWQRPFVWTEAQSIRFIESAWMGLSLGTYTYNQTTAGSPTDGLLIDGQQRMYSIEKYLNDEFPVFGYRWSEVTELDKRLFKTNTIFGCYVTSTEDEDYLRSYYDLMNFGGTAHTEDQRAIGDTK